MRVYYLYGEEDVVSTEMCIVRVGEWSVCISLCRRANLPRCETKTTIPTKLRHVGDQFSFVSNRRQMCAAYSTLLTSNHACLCVLSTHVKFRFEVLLLNIDEYIAIISSS